MSGRTTRIILLAMAATGLLGLYPAVATAGGTGVDTTHRAAPLSPDEARFHAEQEAAYEAWLAQGNGGGGAPVAARGVDIPNYYITTPSHKQANGYFCGPATCQIIDDYWGSYVSQSTYANFTVNGVPMCSRDGTIFGYMDNCLRKYTGKSYDYHGPVADATDFYNRVSYGLYSKHFPEALLIRIVGSDISWYVYDHRGHIVCLDAFDWRINADGVRTVRLNDPYNEADYYTYGGKTYGHKVYPRAQIAEAIQREPSRAMLY